jgi:hypothetical protein
MNDIVGRLLKQGARPDQRNNFGYSALMIASQEGRIDVVKTLLNAGADRSLKEQETRNLGRYRGGFGTSGNCATAEVAMPGANFTRRKDTPASLDAVGFYSIAPFPDECCNQFGRRRIVVCDNVEAGCNETQPNDLNGIASNRSHLIGYEFYFGSPAGLLVTNDERSIRRSQCFDLGQRDVAGSQPFALYPGVRVKEDEIRATYRGNKSIEPFSAQWCRTRHPLAQEDRIFQYSTHVQLRQRINERTAASIKFHELIEHIRSEVSKVIRALEIVEMSVATVHCIAFAGQIPANSKTAIFRKMPKQSELSEVAYSSDLPNLHCASQTYNGRRIIFWLRRAEIPSTVAEKPHVKHGRLQRRAAPS